MNANSNSHGTGSSNPNATEEPHAPSLQGAVRKRDSRLLRALLDRIDPASPNYSPWDTGPAPDTVPACRIKQTLSDGEFTFQVLTHPLVEKGYRAQDVVAIQDALNEAIRRGSREMVTRLLENGAVVNPTCRTDAHQPLFLAVNRGGKRIFKLLLKRGAIPCSSYSDQCSFRAAVSTGRYTMVRLFLDEQYSSLCTHRYGIFYWPIVRGDTKMVKLLVKCGLDLHIHAPYPLALAIQHCHVMAELSETTEGNVVYPAIYSSDGGTADPTPHTLIYHALSLDSMEILRLLVEAGMRPALEDLRLAEKKGNSEAIALLSRCFPNGST